MTQSLSDIYLIILGALGLGIALCVLVIFMAAAIFLIKALIKGEL